MFKTEFRVSQKNAEIIVEIKVMENPLVEFYLEHTKLDRFISTCIQFTDGFFEERNKFEFPAITVFNIISTI